MKLQTWIKAIINSVSFSFYFVPSSLFSLPLNHNKPVSVSLTTCSLYFFHAHPSVPPSVHIVPPTTALPSSCFRGVSHLLAAFFCDSHSEHPLQDMLRASWTLQRFHLAGLRQQCPQPRHLHHLQHRVQTGLHQNPQLLRGAGGGRHVRRLEWKWGCALVQ